MEVAVASRFLALLTVASQVAVVALVVLAIAGLRSERVAAWERERLAPSALGVAWLVATVATAGSLYYSEVAHFVPCTLCWYQRIAMYPLTIVLGVAVLRHDAAVWRYALGLTVPGALIGAYHYQLQRFPTQASVACDVSSPCSLTWVWELSYVSIPLMALTAFVLVTALLLVARLDPPHAVRSRP